MNFKIQQKRIKYVIVIVCISILTYGIINLVNSNQEVLLVNSTPITNKVIILDAGHGLPDEGAVGFYGTSEQAINLSITLKLQKLIEQSGAKVILTRSNENGIYSTDQNSIKSKKISDIKNRVVIGNNSDADILISIHLNKFPASSYYSGWQTFYQKNNENSKNLADCIQNNLNRNIQKENKRNIMSISNIYLMDHVKIPSVIVECGFLSNEEETSNLRTDEYQNKLAWGIYTGLQEYFSKVGNNEQ